jgi:sulfatase modifying factor 1
MSSYSISVIILMVATTAAAFDTELTRVEVSRRPGTLWLDIEFEWDSGEETGVGRRDSAWVVVEASADSGISWDQPVLTVAGDIGRISPGMGRISWYQGADTPSGASLLWKTDPPLVRLFVSADPPIPTDYNMVLVSGAAFTMGSEQGDQHEAPPHTVQLSPYWIDRYETTNRAFQYFVQSTGWQTGAEKAGSSVIYRDGGYHTVEGACWRRPSGGNSDLSDRLEHPVVQVDWNDATAYCRWAGKRLPTEAEWEHAARGTDTRTYPWGETNSHVPIPFANAGTRNCCHESAHDGFLNTAPVGSFPQGVSPVGALDMAGNAWEWTGDYFDPYFYSNSSLTDPKGPTSGDERVLRGGSWISYAFMLRTSYRGHHTPETRHNYSGFRCVRE